MPITYDNVPVELALHSIVDCQRIIAENVVSIENEIIEDDDFDKAAAVRETSAQIIGMLTNGFNAIPKMVITPDQDRIEKQWGEAMATADFQTFGVRTNDFGIWTANNIAPGLLNVLEQTRIRLAKAAIKD